MRARWGFGIDEGDASERAEALLAADPADADLLNLAASVRGSRGDNSGALDAARRAVAAAAGSARAHTTLSALLAATGDIPGARSEAAAAVALDGDDPAARYNRGVLAWVAGERATARQDFDAVRAMLERDGDIRPGFVRSWVRAWRRRRG